ncbi:putative NmrA-like domain, NAD(P)-binding domain superfamily [Septoria linicola]|nr:putative NmrA-like domain, NAD(P)-binding domain superfamily [Septoria linicola]
MAKAKSTIAVFGGTGDLGQQIVAALLQPEIRQAFAGIVVVSRSATKLQRWQRYGVLLRQCTPQNLVAILAGVDIVIDAIAPAGADFSRRLIAAMAQSKVKVYFPPEFDVDHNLHDFRFAEWDWKKSNVALAREVLKQTQVCQIFSSLILEKSFGPWLGFCTRRRTYACVGSKDVASSYTSLADLARSVVEVALLKPARIPAQVHLGGCTKSMAEVSAIMSRESGESIRVVELPLSMYKASVLAAATSTRAEHLRFVMGEGKANHGRHGLWNSNELVNPDQTRWKWKAVEHLAKQSSGRPFASVDWPAG